MKSSELIKPILFSLLMLSVLAGCMLTAPPTVLPALTAVATPTPAYPWTDENAIVSGICFEAALDAAGQVFIISSAEDHKRFYDLADGSQLCRHPVARVPFDFGGGRILTGLWSAGHGCTARHDVMAIERDDTARTLTIGLRFVTEGDCNYELVRPFWIGLDGVENYTINMTLVN